MSIKKIPIGVIGASGFTGQELVALLSADTNVEILFLQSKSQSGKENTHAKMPYEDLNYSEMIARKPECVFFCTPNGTALIEANQFLEEGIKVIDLSADYRFTDPKLFEETYGMNFPHENTHQQAANNDAIFPHSVLKKIVYGLPEFFSEDLKNAALIANPGCYVTAGLLSTLPLLSLQNTRDFPSADREGIIERIVFDGKSGYSGAGVKNAEEFKKNLEQNFQAYALTGHRHEAEIQQFFPNPISFTPHLLPFFRGIEMTSHIFLNPQYKDFDFFAFYQEFYKNKKYVQVQKEIPSISQVQNTNNIIIGGFEIDHNKRLVITAVEDNLRKGASSQAVQNFHVMFGLPEEIPELGGTKIFE